MNEPQPPQRPRLRKLRHVIGNVFTLLLGLLYESTRGILVINILPIGCMPSLYLYLSYNKAFSETLFLSHAKRGF